MNFPTAMRFLSYLRDFIRGGGSGLEVCVRASLMLIDLHRRSLIGSAHNNPALEALISDMRVHVRERVSRVRNTVGMNVAALKCWRRELQNVKQMTFFGPLS